MGVLLVTFVEVACRSSIFYPNISVIIWHGDRWLVWLMDLQMNHKAALLFDRMLYIWKIGWMLICFFHILWHVSQAC